MPKERHRVKVEEDLWGKFTQLDYVRLAFLGRIVV